MVTLETLYTRLNCLSLSSRACRESSNCCLKFEITDWTPGSCGTKDVGLLGGVVCIGTDGVLVAGVLTIAKLPIVGAGELGASIAPPRTPTFWLASRRPGVPVCAVPTAGYGARNLEVLTAILGSRRSSRDLSTSGL